jgi:hypothetical protein
MKVKELIEQLQLIESAYPNKDVKILEFYIDGGDVFKQEKVNVGSVKVYRECVLIS